MRGATVAPAPARAVTGRGTPASDQKFNITFRATQGRFGDANHRPAHLRRQPGLDIGANGGVHGRVADHTLFADGLAASLKLRLDQRDQISARPGQREGRRQNQFERDEASVTDHQIGQFGHRLRPQ